MNEIHAVRKIPQKKPVTAGNFFQKIPKAQPSPKNLNKKEL
jgi:hypothetical protein